MDGKLSNLVSIPSLAWSLTVFVALGYLARRLHVCPFSFLTKTLGCRRVILLMVTGALALVLLPSYYVLILRWGTVNPYFVLSRTAPATWPNGQRPGPATASARNWRPPERLVVSLTSLPHRIITSDFRSVIDSLFRQTLLPDAIYLSLPQRSRGNTTFSNEHIASIPTRITVLRPEVDLGPVMKLVPVLKVEKEPGTIIVTLDDDQIYHPDLLRLLAWNAVHRPEAAHGACGWGFLWVWPIGPSFPLRGFAHTLMRRQVSLRFTSRCFCVEMRDGKLMCCRRAVASPIVGVFSTFPWSNASLPIVAQPTTSGCLATLQQSQTSLA